MKLIVVAIALIVALQSTDATDGTNLLVNPDFESDFNGNWYCFSCTLTKVKSGVDGTYAAQITQR
jgi:hypothetical protein